MAELQERDAAVDEQAVLESASVPLQQETPALENIPRHASTDSKIEAIMAMDLELREQGEFDAAEPSVLAPSVNNTPGMNREIERMPEPTISETIMDAENERVRQQLAQAPQDEDFFDHVRHELRDDNERDENAGFHESNGRAALLSTKPLSNVSAGNILLHDQLLLRGLSIAALRRKRRGGFTLALRSGRLEDVLCAEEADAAEELMRSIYGSESSGLQQTYSALINLARQMANALRGELPLETYTGQNTEDFGRLISIVAEKRCQLMKEALEDALGEGSQQLYELLCRNVKTELERLLEPAGG